MKILIVRSFANIVNPNSYNLQEIGMARGIVRTGHTCDVVYYNGKNDDKEQIIEFDNGLSIKIYWLKGYSILKDGIMPSLKGIVKRYDKVIFDSYNALLSLWAVKKIPEKCVIYQGPYPSEFTKRYQMKTKIIDILFYSFVDKSKIKIMCKSVPAAGFLRKKGFTDVTEIGVGLNTDNFENMGDTSIRDDLKKQLEEYAGNARLLLYIGVIEARRDIVFLIEILYEILKLSQNYKLLIVGKGEEGYVGKVKGLIKKYGIDDYVKIIDRIDQCYLNEVYKISDAFVFSSLYEIFGMVLLEAMYFGLPVFTTYNGGSSMLIKNDNGIVISEHNPVIWAKEINRILNNPEVSGLFAENARSTITDYFTWNAMASKIISVIET